MTPKTTVKGVKNKMPKRHKTRPLFLTREQTHRTLELARGHSERFYLMVKTMVTTGIRVSDYINLTKDNFQNTPTLGYILVFKAQKNKQEITAPITKEIYNIAHSLNGKIFRLKRWSAWSILKMIGRKQGIRLTPHMLRHTFVVLARQAGVSWELIAGITGDDFATLKDWYHAIEPREILEARRRLTALLEAQPIEAENIKGVVKNGL